jgi:uncharacterized protein YndB with AHSA1/START domain
MLLAKAACAPARAEEDVRMINPTPAQVAAIERELQLRQPPERVWRAITDPEELSAWFSNATTLDLRAGGDAKFTWTGGHPDAGQYYARIEKVEPTTSFAWRWAQNADTPVDEGPSTLVEWDLRPTADGGTNLRLRESGFQREEDRAGNDEGWTEELAELKQHLEAA